ncbi:MAG: TRAP transporter small permease [Candidatus Omnitrophota bacterium]|jgi:TRAP-type C4-dicarboxylate transport system permease small subunit|nr:MAG: TRAP transporter small permease [Candidatus Omnitrophota bacterium]
MKKYLWEERILVLILAIQVLLVCLGVLSRYAFNWSLSFTEEITRYLILWLACLGLPVCLARDEMIRFQWPREKSLRLARFLRLFSYTASVVFFVLLLFSAMKMIRLQWQFGQKTSVMGWSIIWVSLALPVTCLLFFYRIYGKLYKNEK